MQQNKVFKVLSTTVLSAGILAFMPLGAKADFGSPSLFEDNADGVLLDYDNSRYETTSTNINNGYDDRVKVEEKKLSDYEKGKELLKGTAEDNLESLMELITNGELNVEQRKELLNGYYSMKLKSLDKSNYDEISSKLDGMMENPTKAALEELKKEMTARGVKEDDVLKTKIRLVEEKIYRQTQYDKGMGNSVKPEDLTTKEKAMLDSYNKAVQEAKAGNTTSYFVLGSKKATIRGARVDVPASFMSGNRVFAPVRYIANAVGATKIDWNDKLKTVVVEKDGIKLTYQVGKKVYYLNNQPIEMDVAPIYKSGRVFLPARFIAEPLGYSVDYAPFEEKLTVSVKMESEE